VEVGIQAVKEAKREKRKEKNPQVGQEEARGDYWEEEEIEDVLCCVGRGWMITYGKAAPDDES
jgi:hypothetical protein